MKCRAQSISILHSLPPFARTGAPAKNTAALAKNTAVTAFARTERGVSFHSISHGRPARINQSTALTDLVDRFIPVGQPFRISRSTTLYRLVDRLASVGRLLHIGRSTTLCRLVDQPIQDGRPFFINRSIIFASSDRRSCQNGTFNSRYRYRPGSGGKTDRGG
jgi:hypothetical protein